MLARFAAGVRFAEPPLETPIRAPACQPTAQGPRTFVPLAFQSGEAFQFDWSEDWAVLGGERTKLQVAHVKRSHSRAFLVRAYRLQTHEMLFDAHHHAFRVLELQRMGRRIRRRQDDHGALDRLIQHRHVRETGNDSFRFKASTAITKGRKGKHDALTKA